MMTRHVKEKKHLKCMEKVGVCAGNRKNKLTGLTHRICGDKLWEITFGK